MDIILNILNHLQILNHKLLFHFFIKLITSLSLYIMIIILIISCFTFFVFAWDKYKARHHKRRISENILLLFSFCGGILGAILAMIICRHKISKRSFILKFIVVLLVQIIVVFFVYQNFFSIR